MILDDDAALAVLKKHSLGVPEWVSEARTTSKELFALILGHDFKEELIKRIEYIESADKAKARAKYSRNITDLYERLLNPISNVFSSTGGSKNYNISSETKLKEFLNTISAIKDGKSIEKYVENR